LRKSLAAVVAVPTVLVMATVAFAQNPAPVVDVTATVKPTKAGTKKKPKSETVKLVINNSRESKTTASRIDITMPKTLKLNTKGLKSCSVARLDASGTAGCSKAKAGSGTADAILNPNSPSDLCFKTTPFVAGKNLIAFYLQQTNCETGAVNEDGVAQALPGKITKAGSGQRLRIDIPRNLQAPVDNPNDPSQSVYSALLKIETTLGLKSGKRALVSSVGCKSKQHKIKTTITYADNPNPPASRTASATDGAPCSK
jgi:hypothetical protein